MAKKGFIKRGTCTELTWQRKVDVAALPWPTRTHAGTRGCICGTKESG